jgi:hypothetical protein
VTELAVSSAQSAKHSSASVDHFTPPDIVEAARAVMGGIDLDPATSYEGNRLSIKATAYFTERDNGMTKPWGPLASGDDVWSGKSSATRLFLNCPGGKCDLAGRSVTHVKGSGYFYSDGSACTKSTQSSTKAWWGKLCAEWSEGRVEQAIFVGFNMEILQSSQGGTWSCMDFPFCIPKKRIAFCKLVSGKLEPAEQPTHGNAIVYLPPRARVREATKKFVEVFTPIGACKA